MEEEIIYNVEVQGIQSIENLTKANKDLREERKKLDLQSAEGQKRAQEITGQYQLINLGDTVLALPSPRSGNIRRNTADHIGSAFDIV